MPGSDLSLRSPALLRADAQSRRLIDRRTFPGILLRGGQRRSGAERLGRHWAATAGPHTRARRPSALCTPRRRLRRWEAGSGWPCGGRKAGCAAPSPRKYQPAAWVPAPAFPALHFAPGRNQSPRGPCQVAAAASDRPRGPMAAPGLLSSRAGRSPACARVPSATPLAAALVFFSASTANCVRNSGEARGVGPGPDTPARNPAGSLRGAAGPRRAGGWRQGRPAGVGPGGRWLLGRGSRAPAI